MGEAGGGEGGGAGEAAQSLMQSGKCQMQLHCDSRAAELAYSLQARVTKCL